MVFRQIKKWLSKPQTESVSPVLALNNEIEGRLLERLQFIRFDPRQIVTLSLCPNQQLMKHYNQAKFTNLPLSLTKLPLADNSVDLIFSNLSLFRAPDIESLLIDINRALTREGLFIFSTLAGPINLNFFQELTSVLSASGLGEIVTDQEAILFSYLDASKYAIEKNLLLNFYPENNFSAEESALRFDIIYGHARKKIASTDEIAIPVSILKKEKL